jgi:hypothetical protein
MGKAKARPRTAAKRKTGARKAAPKKSGWGGARPGAGAKLTMGEPLDQHTSLAYTATQRARWRAAAQAAGQPLKVWIRAACDAYATAQRPP